MEVVLQNTEAAAPSHTMETKAQITFMRSSRIADGSLLHKGWAGVGGWGQKEKGGKKKTACGKLKHGELYVNGFCYNC